MVGLAAHARRRADANIAKTAMQAAEVFLGRRLFKRKADGSVIHPAFVALHYPLYWHYDILGGLKAMKLVGRIRDARCADALDLLESKRLSDGGWPATKPYYTSVSPRALKSNADYVRWGGTSATRMNEWVTV